MRVRHVMITAAIAGIFVACAGSSDGGDGGADKPVYATVCEARCACEGCSEESKALCEGEQNAIRERADEESCQEKHGALVECVRLEGRCVDGHHLAEVCNAQAAALLGCLDPDDHCETAGDGTCDEPEGTGKCNEGTDPADCLSHCPTTGNGVCDEPEGTGTCPAGTDVEDCKLKPCESTNDGVCDEPSGTDTCPAGTDVLDCADVCPSTNNGICDEPVDCAEGTDIVDCAGEELCLSTNDGICDEPEGSGDCPEGTDVADCRAQACPYTDDGFCDEPEGSGDCPEGTDVNDCSTSGTCDDAPSCNACRSCAMEGSCADEADACAANLDCVDFANCIVTCEDGDTACAQACEEARPLGAALRYALESCVDCDECRFSCADESMCGG